MLQHMSLAINDALQHVAMNTRERRRVENY
jgi:hypothetical protein